ncbi:MAG: tetratricopeptide repeat protein, partial [Sulfitobacter sp.]
GIMYQNGNGVGQDEARAAEIFQMACDKGEVLTGCFNIGIMYQNGIGVGQDEARAAGLYQMACTVGNEASCFNLGIMYQNGNGVGQDEARAVELYQMACDKGNTNGCTNAQYIMNTKRLLKEASDLCFRGIAIQCIILGTSLEARSNRGLATTVGAFEAFTKACRLGDPIGCGEANRISNQ